MRSLPVCLGAAKRWRRPCWPALALRALLFCAGAAFARAAPVPASPDQLYGDLFVAVQRAQVFPDQKTFVDAVPRTSPDRVMEAFRREKPVGRAALAEFVERHFLVPVVVVPEVPETTSLEAHINVLWDVLRRQPDIPVRGSSLLALPHPYIVPGGRFREIYYWDSYFTMLGLRESGREDLIKSMIDNFAYLIGHYGLIPNGNRTYYLSRSQPPFFAAMVELLAEEGEGAVRRTYLEALRAEYAYWNDEAAPTRHRVDLPDGHTLQRYYDQRAVPRPESYLQDVRTAAAAPVRAESDVYRDLRSAAESGWDFSSRWFESARGLPSTRTTQFVPVDLNCLLWQLETTLAAAEEEAGNGDTARNLRQVAQRRQAAIRRFCWSSDERFFVDYDVSHQRPSVQLTLAGVVPLYFGIATQEQADAVARVVRERFLQPGGVVTTLADTGEQWDWPNGWAPLQWMAIRGLDRYGHRELAAEIARRWIELNVAVYQRTGRLMEKYNVVDTSLPAGGGEYDAQDGFGWTNGVLLALRRHYGEP